MNKKETAESRLILAEVIKYYKDHSTRATAQYFHIDYYILKRYLAKNNIIEHTREENKLFGQIKSKQTCLEKYGVEYSFQSDNNKEKSKQTSLIKYGVEHLQQSSIIKEKTKQTCLEKYNVNSPLCLVKNKELAMLEKYGEDNALKLDWVKEKVKNTNINNIGVEWQTQADDFKFKSHQTKQQQYGDPHYHNSEKAKITCIKKYGVPYYAQSDIVQKYNYYKYYYNSERFDSLPELAVWIYCINNNINIQRNKQKFKYIYNNTEHYYFPDFIINGKLVEIKGDHFFKSDGTMCNPFDHSQDNLYEAKHQCGLKHNVEFWMSKEYNKYITYCKQQFGNNWELKFILNREG